MQAIREWGIEFIVFIQSFQSTGLDQFFHVVTQFGVAAPRLFGWIRLSPRQAP